MYSKPLQAEFNRRLDTVALSMHAQIGMERDPRVGWGKGKSGSMNYAIQRAQDQNVVAAGGFQQQAMDRLRLDRNDAVHQPFGQALVGNGGAGPMQMMLPASGPPSARGVHPNSRFALE